MNRSLRKTLANPIQACSCDATNARGEPLEDSASHQASGSPSITFPVVQARLRELRSGYHHAPRKTLKSPTDSDYAWEPGVGAGPGMLAPTSEVDWMDSQLGWISAVHPRDAAQPEVVYQRMLRGRAGDQEGVLFEVRYRTWSGSDWTGVNVDELLLFAPYPSLGIDSFGMRHVSYTLAKGDGVEVVYRQSADGQQWSRLERVVVPGLRAGRTLPSPIGVDGQGRPYVAAIVSQGANNFAVEIRRRVAENDWRVVGIPRACRDEAVSLAVEQDGRCHLAFEANNGVNYLQAVAGQAGGAPVAQPFGAGAGARSPALYVAGNQPHLVWLGPGNPRILYQTLVRGRWRPQLPIVIDDNPNRVGAMTTTTMCRAADSTIRVAYRTGASIWYREGRPNGALDPEQLQLSLDEPAALFDACRGVLAPGLAIVTDRNSNPEVFFHVDVFQRSNVGGPVCVHWARPWPRTIRTAFVPNEAPSTSFVQSDDKEPHIVFISDDRQRANSQLIVRSHTPRGWRDGLPVGANAVVGDPPPEQRGSCVASGADGVIGVAFADSVRGELRFLSTMNPLGNWIPSPAIWTAPVADFALAYDYSTPPRPRVVFALRRGNQPGPIIFAEQRRPGGGWQTQEVNAIGQDVSLTTDALSNEPRIAFAAGRAPWLRVFVTARQMGTIWRPPERVADAGRYTSIASRRIGGQERLWVGYFDLTGRFATLRRLGPGQWGDMKEDDGGVGAVVGRYPSLAVDTFGFPVAAYENLTSSMLRIGRFNRLAGNRVVGQSPPGQWEACDVTPGGRGNWLLLDTFDNPRVSHMEAAFKGHTIDGHFPWFVSRP